MTLTLETPVATGYGSDAEDIANLYATMLRNAGWTVDLGVTFYEGHRDPSGELWAKERVHVVLQAKREGDGHLVASWTSTTQAPKGQRCSTKRGLSLRCEGYPAEPRKLSTYRQFWLAIEDMTR